MKSLFSIAIAFSIIGTPLLAEHAPSQPIDTGKRATQTSTGAESFECTAICGVYFAGEYLTTLRSKVESAKGPSAKQAFESLEKKCDSVMKGYVPTHIDGNRFLPGDTPVAATLKNACTRIQGPAAKKQKCTAICGVFFAGKYFTTIRSKVESASGVNAGEAFKTLEKKCDGAMKGYIPVHIEGNRFLPGDDASAATPRNSCGDEE